MLLMVENGIRGGICQATHRYAKANNKYMDNYDNNIEPSYLALLDANSLSGWAMSQKFPVSGFKWLEKLSKFNQRFIKNYDENSNIGCILEVDVKYPKNLLNSHKGLRFLPERKKNQKIKKTYLQHRRQRKYTTHIRDQKQALNDRLILKRVHRALQFNQKVWLKSYIDINIRKKSKNEFEKVFFKLMNNSALGKTMENARNHGDIKLVTTEKKEVHQFQNQIITQQNTIQKNLLAIEMKKTKVIMNKHVYLGMSILDISKILISEFWYDYIKPKYGDRAKLCYTDTDSLMLHIITEDFYEDIPVDVERWFDTSNYDENDKRPLSIGKNKKVPGLFKDELGGKIIKELCALRPKAYAYLIDGYDDGYYEKK